MTIFALMVGAALGAVCRASILDAKVFQGCDIPFGTLMVNISGSFLMGILLPLIQNTGMMYTGIIFGFLGGYTTYSTFSLNQLTMLKKKRYKNLFKYSFITLFFSLAALSLGLLIGVSI